MVDGTCPGIERLQLLWDERLVVSAVTSHPDTGDKTVGPQSRGHHNSPAVQLSLQL